MPGKNDSMGTASGTRKERLFSVISVMLGLIVALTAAEWLAGRYIAMIQSSSTMQPGLLRYHSALGWDLTPGWQGEHKHHDYVARYSINSQGFRRAQGETPSADAYRIAVVGDSFTFGLGVNEGEVFTDYLNQWSRNVRSNRRFPLAFINYGVPGTSTDQHQLLLARRIIAQKPDRVLLVIYLANDLFDNELSFPLQAENAKPYYQLSEGGLHLQNVPVPQQRKPAQLRGKTLASVVMKDNTAAQPWLIRKMDQLALPKLLGWQSATSTENPQAIYEARFHSAIVLFDAIIGKVVGDLKAQDIELNLLLLAGRSFVENPDSVSALYQDYLRKKVIEIAKHRGLHYIDAAAALRTSYAATAETAFFPYDGHLTAQGHQLLSSVIIQGIDFNALRVR